MLFAVKRSSCHLIETSASNGIETGNPINLARSNKGLRDLSRTKNSNSVQDKQRLSTSNNAGKSDQSSSRARLKANGPSCAEINRQLLLNEIPVLREKSNSTERSHNKSEPSTLVNRFGCPSRS